MINLDKNEQHYIELAQRINLDEIDYDIIMAAQTRHTYRVLTVAGAIVIVALVFFIAEFIPGIKSVGTGMICTLFFIALVLIFHALRYQKEMETRVTYEILQKIQAIEGQSGFLWRLNNIINAYCQERFGALPNGVQQLQTSSQAGGIEVSEIKLYKQILQESLRWYEQNRPEEESG